MLAHHCTRGIDPRYGIHVLQFWTKKSLWTCGNFASCFPFHYKFISGFGKVLPVNVIFVVSRNGNTGSSATSGIWQKKCTGKMVKNWLEWGMWATFLNFCCFEWGKRNFRKLCEYSWCCSPLHERKQQQRTFYVNVLWSWLPCQGQTKSYLTLAAGCFCMAALP